MTSDSFAYFAACCLTEWMKNAYGIDGVAAQELAVRHGACVGGIQDPAAARRSHQKHSATAAVCVPAVVALAEVEAAAVGLAAEVEVAVGLIAVVEVAAGLAAEVEAAAGLSAEMEATTGLAAEGVRL